MNGTLWTANGPAFVALAGIGLVMALLTVTLKNMVHCALTLAGTLICIAGLFLTLNADLVAGVQLLIYVGAVITLLLIAIMLIRSIADRRIVQTTHRWLPATFIAAALFGVFTFVLLPTPWPVKTSAEVRPLDLPQQTGELATTLLSHYLLPFEVASVVLLVALVGALVIAHEERKRLPDET